MLAAERQPILYPGERLVRSATGLPCIVYLRPGRRDQPLIVFLSGGGHLARVAYGHPGSDPSDFLDGHLAERGYGLLALSHPIEHPVFDRVYPDVTVTEWSEAVAEICRDALRRLELPARIVLIAWSMSGRWARSIKVAAASRGVVVDAFIGLAATPPLPGLSPVDPTETGITPAGLRDFLRPADAGRKPYSAAWAKALAEQDALNWHTIIPIEIYWNDYVGANPVSLHGEAMRRQNGSLIESLTAAFEDVGTLRFDEFPLCGCIIPTGVGDARHSLVDRASWGFFNAQMVASRYLGQEFEAVRALSDAAWTELRELVDTLPQRLGRMIAGNHFFFLGSRGARTTAQHVDALVHETRLVNGRIAAILGISADRKQSSFMLEEAQC